MKEDFDWYGHQGRHDDTRDHAADLFWMSVV